MEGLQATTNLGALHKSGLRSTKPCVVEYFRCNSAHCFGVDKLVEPYVHASQATSRAAWASI
eukprot:4413106-Pleurochrysis_carterae.AAC.1